jgi:hypothetical protein
VRQLNEATYYFSKFRFLFTQHNYNQKYFFLDNDTLHSLWDKKIVLLRTHWGCVRKNCFWTLYCCTVFSFVIQTCWKFNQTLTLFIHCLYNKVQRHKINSLNTNTKKSVLFCPSLTLMIVSYNWIFYVQSDDLL